MITDTRELCRSPFFFHLVYFFFFFSFFFFYFFFFQIEAFRLFRGRVLTHARWGLGARGGFGRSL